MSTTARRKPKAMAEATPKNPNPPPYIDPGWTCKAADMIVPWDGRSESWIEKEAAHLVARIEAFDGHPDPPTEAAGRLLHDARLMMIGLLNLAAGLRDR